MVAKELSIKLLIDTKAQKVCFAEVESDVVEFLSSLLCLPLSTTINLLSKERMVGSIGNVLGSVQELGAKYVIPFQTKEPYLNPAVAPGVLCPLQQLLDEPLNVNIRCFTCSGKKDSHSGTRVVCGYFSPIEGSTCPSCSRPMNKEMPHVKNEGFAVGTTTYTVTDDLSITPASSMSSITLLARCGVKDVGTLQERTVKIGKDEALEILLASLKSNTVLTDAFLPKKKVRCKKEAAA